MKKLSCMLLCLVLSVTMLSTVAITAGAEEFTEGIYTYTVENGEATIIKCDESVSGELVIPSTLGGYPVTTIGNYAFSNCSSLTSITIPDSVTTIFAFAFLGCSSLTSITIPDSVTSIGAYSFPNCSSLTSITIPDSVTYIGEHAFHGCSSLTSITIPDSVTYIGAGAFQNTAYYNDSSNWENELLYIGNHLIEAKKMITSATLKNGTKTIAAFAFYNCSSLTNIIIPDSVTSIGGYSFSDCSSLTSITIPDSVTSIGEYMFFNCQNLKDIYFAGSQEQWENAVGQANLELNENATIHFNSTGNHTPEISVLVNNQAISFDQPPVIENDRTLVPLRAIFEALGAEVLWDGETSTVTATRGDITISLQIGSNQLYKNGEAITIDVPAQIINDRTMVPVRAIAESFNCRVGWDSDTKTVTITE